MAFRSPRPEPAPAAPIFYTKEFLSEYGTAGPMAPDPPQQVQASPPPAPPPPEPPAPAPAHELKGMERNRILAELREEELSAAEAATQRIGHWAAELQSRTVPCLAEQAEVERCYASPPGGDQLRCAQVVDAFVRCAKM